MNIYDGFSKYEMRECEACFKVDYYILFEGYYLCKGCYLKVKERGVDGGG